MDPQLTRPTPAQVRAVLDQGKRRRTRHKLNVRVYVTLDQGSDGIIRDLSEYGVAVQAVTVLRIHQHVRLRFELVNPRTRVEAVGQVTWANGSGQAGIQFTQIGKRTQQLLKDWLLMNLLATASYVSSASGIFQASKEVEQNTDLIFSGNPRRPIQLSGSEPLRLDTQRVVQEGAEEVSPDPFLDFSWWPVPIAARTFSGVVDGLILLIAVLLFGVISLAIVQQIPWWPAGLGLSVAVTPVFSALYWLMFVVHGAGTPGSRLARIAASTRHQT